MSAAAAADATSATSAPLSAAANADAPKPHPLLLQREQIEALRRQQEERRQQRLESIRAIPRTQYILSCATEAAATGLVYAPLYIVYHTLRGGLEARAASAFGQTYGGMLSAGMRISVNRSARTFGFVVGATAFSAWFRELLQVGPRHREGDPSSFEMVANAGGGLLAGVIVLARMELNPSRRLVLLAMAAASGAVLPSMLASLGPTTRGMLAQVLT